MARPSEASPLLPPIPPGQEPESAETHALPLGPHRERRKIFQPPQEWLFPYQNPLGARLGKAFFAGIPKTPGVYLMYGMHDALLYVGKAKNLRARLLSYRRAHPDQVSRKVIRLVNIIERIEFEECASEEAALLRENELLRERRPPFNVVNTSPESYYLIGMSFREALPEVKDPLEVSFQLTTNPEVEADEVFGAYKGRGTVRMGYGALLRLLWLSQVPSMDRFGFPGQLCRRQPPYLYTVKLHPRPELPPGGWANLLRRFFRGTSRGLLSYLTERLLEVEGIHPFYYHCIQEDLETLQDFYDRGPHRNRGLSRFHGRTETYIAQEEIDDLLVRYGLRRDASSP